VTCAWGDYSAEGTVHVVFTAVESLPDGMLLNGESEPEDIHVTAGEECQIIVSWDPEDYGFTDRTWLDIDLRADCDVWWDWIGGNRVQHIKCYDPGLYYVVISMNNGNLRMTRGLRLYVADENGNLPETVPWFAYEGEAYEIDYMLGTLATDNVTGWATTPYVFGWWLDNLDDLYNAYGQDPEIEWTYEYVSGPEAELRILPRNYYGTMGDGCGVIMETMPAQAGTMEFNLNCSWDGHVGTLPVRINFVEPANNLASDTSFPDRLTLPAGESIRMMGFYTEEGDYDVPADYAILDIPENDLFGIEWEDEVTFTLTGLNAGSITITTGVGGYGKLYYHKRMTINVVDTVIRLPDELETVETEAFAGVDDVVVYIPSSVTTIEDDAFEPHVTVICPADSYAYDRCSAMGLYVIGK